MHGRERDDRRVLRFAYRAVYSCIVYCARWTLIVVCTVQMMPRNSADGFSLSIRDMFAPKARKKDKHVPIDTKVFRNGNLFFSSTAQRSFKE